MPARYIPLATGEYYHIFNRGNAKQPIFINKKDYERFVFILSYYRFNNPPVKLSRLFQLPINDQKQIFENLKTDGEKLVEIISYVLLPNHFHLLLRQELNDGISTFMRRGINSWTRYFNTKYERPGALFQGSFKAVHISDEEQLIHLSRYIHLNPLISFIVKENNLFNYPWSSLPIYLNRNSTFVYMDPVLSNFKTSESYKKFILDQIDYAKKLEEIKHLLLE